MNESNHVDLPADDAEAPSLDAHDSDLDALCESWVYWCRERRLYGPTSISAAAIARQSVSTRPLRIGADVAMSAASLAAFHIAYTCQPNSLDKQVFDLYYLARVKPVKVAAEALGIGRRHFYRVLIDFRRRLEKAAAAIDSNIGIHNFEASVKNESVPSTQHKTDN